MTPSSGSALPAVAPAEPGLLLGEAGRAALWKKLIEIVEAHIRSVPGLRVAPALDPAALRALLDPLDFTEPLGPVQALDLVAGALAEHQVHTPHPRYFGLFNPAPATMGIAADALVAAFNPQLAAWSHSPFAAEAERHLIQAFGERFGYETASVDGTFASGGAEANHTAVLAALVQRFPAFSAGGLRALNAQPTLYVSAESHHSFLKAARLCGLGTAALREVAVDEELRLRPDVLADRLERDRADGCKPFLIVATAGTTNAGAVDPIEALAEIAASNGCWFHVDAAWGGAAALVPELRPLLDGIHRADSITFDAHKWLSVPMGAGLFITRHTDILGRTFRTDAGYMPRDAAGLEIRDPFAHSMQWSRRFTGLKLLLSLMVAGWDGYAATIRHQTAMGERLRQRLTGSSWRVVNSTPLPVVCFVDASRDDGASAEYLDDIARRVVRSGKAWLSTTRLRGDTPALRACITSYRTQPEDVDSLVALLGEVREAAAAEPSRTPD